MVGFPGAQRKRQAGRATQRDRAVCRGDCGVDCDGTDDFVNLGATSQMPTNAFTFAMWVNPDTTCSSEQDIVREEDQTLDAGGFISGCGWTSTKFRGYAYTGSYVSTGDSSTTISAGTWYHVAITYDKDAGTNNLKLYVNGSNESSATTTNPISWTASRNVTLCNYRVFSSYPGTLSAQYPFNGKISSMGVWSKALSAVEINQLYLSKADVSSN